MDQEVPESPVLFSTVTYYKFWIQERYCNGTHYVWCSEHFDSAQLGAYNPDQQTGPTSNPRSIYTTLCEAVESGDQDCEKIRSQKSTLKDLATEWWVNGEINETEAEDIHYMMDQGTFANWKPLLYVIPTQLVKNRVDLVPLEDRASLGREWIIESLDRDEFKIVEI